MSSIKSLGMSELLERALTNVGRAGSPGSVLFFYPFMPPIVVPRPEPSETASDVTP
jgi:hypothetical protein